MINYINKLYAYFLFSLPLLVGLQSFLPKLLEQGFIAFKLIIFPLIVFAYVGGKNNIIWVYLIFVHFFILYALYEPAEMYQFYINSLSIFSSIPLFILGKYLIESNKNFHSFIYLVYGVTAFNLITISLFIFILLGIIDISTIYEIVSRTNDTIYGVYRFALGNAIEVPFIMTTLLFTGIILYEREDNEKLFLFPTFINLLVSLISQSRIVIIIALIIFIYQFIKTSFLNKILIFLFSLIVIISFSLYVDEIILSLVERLSGDDAGSADNRLILFETFLDNFLTNNFLFGNGITSSYQLNYIAYGIYATGESVVIEILYDTGILGVILILFPLIKNNFKYLFFGKYNFTLIFIYIQIMFLLPIFSSMLFVSFLFGICRKN